MDSSGKRRCAAWPVFLGELSSGRPKRSKAAKAERAAAKLGTGGAPPAASSSTSAARKDTPLLHTHDITDDRNRSLGLRYHTSVPENPETALQQLKTYFGMYCDLWNKEDGVLQSLTECLSDERISQVNLLRQQDASYDFPLDHGAGISFRYEMNVTLGSADSSLPLVTRYSLVHGETPLLQYHTSSPEEARFALEQLQGMFHALQGRGQSDLDLMVSQLPGLEV